MSIDSRGFGHRHERVTEVAVVLTGYPGTAVYAPVVAPPSGKALVITSLDIDTYTAPTPGQNVVVEFGVSATNATCTASPVTPVEFVNPTGLGLTSITIPSGLVVPANRALCGIEASGLSAVATAHGYLVTAASAPTGTSARGPVHPPTPRPQPLGNGAPSARLLRWLHERSSGAPSYASS